jgi:hypothetical protein
MESLKLFILGIRDSLRIPKAFIEIFSNDSLFWKTLYCVGINGCIYLGSVVAYMVTMSVLTSYFGEYKNFVFDFLKFIMGLLYYLWILMIYLIAMTLTTFWAQDIFDEVSKIKMKRLTTACVNNK